MQISLDLFFLFFCRCPPKTLCDSAYILQSPTFCFERATIYQIGNKGHDYNEIRVATAINLLFVFSRERRTTRPASILHIAVCAHHRRCRPGAVDLIKLEDAKDKWKERNGSFQSSRWPPT
jgi:hypothetical protein